MATKWWGKHAHPKRTNNMKQFTVTKDEVHVLSAALNFAKPKSEDHFDLMVAAREPFEKFFIDQVDHSLQGMYYDEEKRSAGVVSLVKNMVPWTRTHETIVLEDSAFNYLDRCFKEAREGGAYNAAGARSVVGAKEALRKAEKVPTEKPTEKPAGAPVNGNRLAQAMESNEV